MHASVNVGCQGKSGPGKIHEVILVLKIVHQKGFFDAIKENPNFPTCHQILHIYRQWLSKVRERMYVKIHLWIIIL